MKGGGWNNPIYRMKGGKPKRREGVTKSNREEEAERGKKNSTVWNEGEDSIMILKYYLILYKYKY